MKNLGMILIAAAAGAVVLVFLCGSETEPAEPVIFYATRPGRATIDRDAQGGNPFASALTELFARPKLTLAELREELPGLTMAYSAGQQNPQVPPALPQRWRIRPIGRYAGRREALVFVFSDYRAVGESALPGADLDAERIATAFETAGFNVRKAVNPTADTLRDALDELAARSRDAEAAVVYATGHSVERDGDVWLLPHTYPFEDGPRRLTERGLRVASLAVPLQAHRANLVFFGGCRTDWPTPAP